MFAVQFESPPSIERVWHCAFSPDGSLLATVGADKLVRIWTSDSSGAWSMHSALEDVQSRTIRSCEFSGNGNFLATASFDGTTVVWENKNNEFKVLTTLEGHENEVKSVAWNASSSLLATCGRDKTIWIWRVPEHLLQPIFNPDGEDEQDPTDWDCISVLTGHTGDVKTLVFHPNMNLLLSCSYDDTIRVWVEDVDDWSCEANLTGHTNTVWSVAFISSDAFASASQDLSIRIWSRMGGTWSQQGVIAGHPHTRTIFSIDFRFGYLLSCGGDNAICVYNYAFKEQNLPVFLARKDSAHELDVNCVRWHPKNPNVFASVGDDGVLKVWTLHQS